MSRKSRAYIEFSAFTGIHWGSWTVSPLEKGRQLYVQRGHMIRKLSTRQRLSLFASYIQVHQDPLSTRTIKDLRAHAVQSVESCRWKSFPRSQGCTTVKATISIHNFMTAPFLPHDISFCSKILWYQWLFLEVPSLQRVCVCIYTHIYIHYNTITYYK